MVRDAYIPINQHGVNIFEKSVIMTIPDSKKNHTMDKPVRLLKFRSMVNTLKDIEIPEENEYLSYECIYSKYLEYYYNSDIIGEI